MAHTRAHSHAGICVAAPLERMLPSGPVLLGQHGIHDRNIDSGADEDTETANPL